MLFNAVQCCVATLLDRYSELLVHLKSWVLQEGGFRAVHLFAAGGDPIHVAGHVAD